LESYSHLARLYDGFMNEVDYEAWAQYVSRLIRRALNMPENAAFSRSPRLLECGCGTGNITVPLAKLGFDITASDISDDMLAVAAEKARSAGLRLPFVRMDMTELTFHRPLDGIIACCDCVNYLAGEGDAEKFFRSAYSLLKAGGALLFDISSKHKLESILGNNAFTDSREECAYFWQNNYDEESGLIEMQLEFFTKTDKTHEGESLYKRSAETHIQRAYPEEALASLLKKAGFSRIESFGDFSLEPPKPNSERIQFLAVKG
jgi:ubiquinone/menaquinone biosynthesis C-methylase UbiE